MFYSLEQMKKDYDSFEKKDARVNFKYFEKYYSLDKLDRCEGIELVKRIFGDKNTNPRGLFSWIEYGKQPTKCNCGVGRQIGVHFKGKTSEIFRYKKDTDKADIVPISESEATKLAENVRTALKNSCNIIRGENLGEKKDYERVYTAICNELKSIGCPDSFKWYWSEDGVPNVYLLKYYLCTFPEKFATTYSPGSQNKVLTKLLPTEEISKIPFVRNGQISIYARKIGADCVNFESFIVDKGFYPQSQNKTDEALEHGSIRIWKISHSPNLISKDKLETFRTRQVITMSSETKALGSSKTTQGHTFMNEIKCGDIFYLCYGNRIQLVGRILSEGPRHNANMEGDWYEYSYDVVFESINDNAYTGQNEQWTPNSNSTLKLIEGEELKRFEEWILIPFFGKHLSDIFDEIDEPVQEFKGCKNQYSSMLIESKNLIFHGAPGTGKSYLARKIAADIISNGCTNEYAALTPEQKKQVEFVQFHPSYDYSDFVEGLRPIINGDGSMSFELKDGIFKKFADRAGKNYENSQKSKETIEKELSAQESMEKFFSDIEELGTNTFKTVNGNKFTVTNVDDHNIHISVPGNAQCNNVSVSIDEVRKMLESDAKFEKVKDVKEFFGKTFATQAHSYDFVLYNEILKRKKTVTESTAKVEELKKYVFIIDEINRGEISKIFGELFFAIDPEYRGKKGEISTQYSNLHPNPDEKFYIPENVYIIGTMNDIDRSVDSFDFAMRRRFRFVELKANDCLEMLSTLKNEDLEAEAKRRMIALNKEIADVEDLNESYQIGASYFLKLKTLDFDELWTYHLRPLLQEYIRGMHDEEGLMERFAKAYGYNEPMKGEANESSPNQG